MNRKRLRNYIKRELEDQGYSYREFGKFTSKYVPGGIGRQSLTHWTTGKYLPDMATMAMIYFGADPQEWLFKFARQVMMAVVNIKIKEMEARNEAR